MKSPSGNKICAPTILANELEWMHNILFAYYAQHGRNYPWREERNPYLILNTELMLQRTKADDVAENWLNIKTNLSQPEVAQTAQEFLSILFTKLGLLKRKDWIINIAEIILKSGQVPDSLDELLKLPGVGFYSACATLAFAFGKNEGLVDANVIRLFERFWRPFPHHDLRQKVRFWLPVSKILGTGGNLREILWGLLDLAGQICTPRNPICFECPLNSKCQTGLERIKNLKT
jgi:A/G-specific adenine glycosylase